jgi:MoaA/NifB/PqqE/SkfB family radical SAM enzyme
LLLGQRAEGVVRGFSHVTISLDAGSAELYREIRGVDGMASVEAGVRRVKEIAPHLPLTARATLHRANYHTLPTIIDTARAMGFDSISFLAADLTSKAFGRERPSGADENDALLLNNDDVVRFEAVVERTVTSHREAFESGFVAQGADDLRRLPRYYAAMRGEVNFHPVRCDAPWVSVVVEADGTVRPCYFHPSVGNVRQKPLARIIQEDLRSFLRELDVSGNRICQRCTCSLHVGLRSRLW